MISRVLILSLAVLMSGCAMDDETRRAMRETGLSLMAGPRYELVDPPQIVQAPQNSDTICRPMGGGSYRCN